MTDLRGITSLASEITFRVSRCSNPTTANLRTLRRNISSELRRLDPDIVIRVALRLVREAAVPRWLTYELLNHDVRAMALVTPSDVARLGRGLSSWGDVDAFACYVAGPAWRLGRLQAEAIEHWSASKDRWWRRAALVSTVPLNSTARGGRGDAARTLSIVDKLESDRDDMVVKALSWALRELAKKEPDCVGRYLAQHERELAPRVLREVRNKLLTGLKNPKRS